MQLVSRRSCICGLYVAGLLVLAVGLPASAVAKPKPISGRLSKSGYTVLAVAADGKATVVNTTGRKFRLRPPAKRVTLHLRAPDGIYAGPIVVGQERKGKRAILGVRAGAKLGKVKIKSGKGYAKPVRKLAKKWVDAGRTAQAKKAVPIGAGNFGLVRSKAHGPKGDTDLDGIPDPLDIDDNGNLVLDNLEHSVSPSARASQVDVPSLGATPVLLLSIADTANANAAGLSAAQSDAALAASGQLQIGSRLGGELDCGGSPDPGNPSGWIGGLSYCTRGGTGSVFPTTQLPPGSAPEFPECCDADNDGFGELPSGGGLSLHPGATSSQIRSGDLLIERVVSDGTETDYAATLQYVFATVPALHSYSDTAGDSATVEYPVAGPTPFPIAAGPGGDVVLTVTFWRPQRRRTEGDPGIGEWVDIGGLTYYLNPFGAAPLLCPQSSFSTTDPSLTLPPAGVPGPDLSGQPGGGFTDTAPDRPADPANTLTFSVNLTECFASRGRTLKPGDEVPGILVARASNTRPDTAMQVIPFRRQP
jgi:hypothetical protein